MPSTFTTRLRLEKPAIGEQANTWGVTVNQNMDKIEAVTGWRVLNTVLFQVAQVDVRIALPTGYSRFRVSWQDFGSTGSAGMYLRFSVDGGATDLGGTAYGGVQTLSQGNITDPTVSFISGESFLRLSPDTTINDVTGSFEFKPYGNKTGEAQCYGLLASGAVFENNVVHLSSDTGTASHLVLGFINTPCLAGLVKLEGRP